MSSFSFLSRLPHGPFELIAKRLECRSCRMFSFLLGERERHTFFVVALQMARFLKRPPLGRLTNVRGSSVLLKGRGLSRGSRLLSVPSSPALFSESSSLIDHRAFGPVIINRFVIAAKVSVRVARNIPLNDHCRTVAVAFAREINVSDSC